MFISSAFKLRFATFKMPKIEIKIDGNEQDQHTLIVDPSGSNKKVKRGKETPKESGKQAFKDLRNKTLERLNNAGKSFHFTRANNFFV